MQERTVGELVRSRPLYVVQEADSVLDVARYMTKYQAKAVPVLAGDQLVGIFAEQDLMARVVALRLDPALTKVGEVMTPTLSAKVMALHADTTWKEALATMKQLDTHHLPVTAGKRLIGCVSLQELQAAEIEHQEVLK